MEMNDSQRIPAAKEKVWAALNDPEVLKACIPGCQSLEMTGPNEMKATVVFKVGPVRATFGGTVLLSEIDPPNSYRISGEGSGGVAGFAKGGAAVRLEAEGDDVTILHYTVDAQVGGKIAQLGGRLIDSTAKKLAGEFFETFAEKVSGVAPAEEGADKPGWFAKFTGTSAVVALLALSGANWCCVTGGHHHAQVMPGPICSHVVTADRG
ncbi:SRPBCC family protein [Bradyrhizobium sp. SYSU BS000235]|uniref:SRPBCC family protein n=1 Tax=Bradyrhizobium sp. SYSU BS000235 TaxID=3411332 RepID=UPI003C75AFFD